MKTIATMTIVAVLAAASLANAGGIAVGGAGHVKVFQAGSGTELTSFTFSPPSSSTIQSLAAGDLDGDGFDDYVFAAQGPAGATTIVSRSGLSGDVTLSGIEAPSDFLSLAIPPPRDAGSGLATGKRILAGGGPRGTVYEYDGISGQLLGSLVAFDSPAIGTYVASTSNGLIVAGPGPGGGPNVKIFDPSASPLPLATFQPFGTTVTGDMSVAAGRGWSDSGGALYVGLAAPPAGGASIIKGFQVSAGAPDWGLTELFSLTPFPGYTGKLISLGDSDVVVGDSVYVAPTGPGGGPHVKVFDGATGAFLRQFAPFGESYNGGFSLALVASPVPEPSGLLLAGLGLIGIAATVLKRRKCAAETVCLDREAT